MKASVIVGGGIPVKASVIVWGGGHPCEGKCHRGGGDIPVKRSVIVGGGTSL